MTAISESKAAEQRAHEPSMEEILASIRRIISEDQALPLSPRTAPPVRLAESTLSAPPVAPIRPLPPTPAYSATRQPEPLRQAPPRLVEPAPAPSASAPVPLTPSYDELEEPLLSQKADAAVSTSFQALNTVRSGLPGAEAMDAMARDLLRPMLKQWLDDNLPPIVERLVRAEIERVARGPR